MPKAEEVIDLINNLSLDEFARLKELGFNDALTRRKNELDRKERSRNRDRAKQRQSREKLLGDAAKNWCAKNLLPDMIVKVKGTRDRSGLRKIVHVQRDELTGWQVIQTKRRLYEPDNTPTIDSRTGKQAWEVVWKPQGAVTTNGLDKVRWVYMDDKWYSIQQLTGV